MAYTVTFSGHDTYAAEYLSSLTAEINGTTLTLSGFGDVTNANASPDTQYFWGTTQPGLSDFASATMTEFIVSENGGANVGTINNVTPGVFYIAYTTDAGYVGEHITVTIAEDSSGGGSGSASTVLQVTSGSSYGNYFASATYDINSTDGLTVSGVTSAPAFKWGTTEPVTGTSGTMFDSYSGESFTLTSNSATIPTINSAGTYYLVAFILIGGQQPLRAVSWLQVVVTESSSGSGSGSDAVTITTAHLGDYTELSNVTATGNLTDGVTVSNIDLKVSELFWSETEYTTGDTVEMAAISTTLNGGSGSVTIPITTAGTYYLYQHFGGLVVERLTIDVTSAGASTPTQLAAPTVTLAATSTTSLTPTISSIEGAISYKLRYRSIPANGRFYYDLTGDGETWISGTAITELSASGIYKIQVKAIGDGVSFTDSDWSNGVIADTKSGGAPGGYIVKFEMFNYYNVGAFGEVLDNISGTFNPSTGLSIDLGSGNFVSSDTVVEWSRDGYVTQGASGTQITGSNGSLEGWQTATISDITALGDFYLRYANRSTGLSYVSCRVVIYGGDGGALIEKRSPATTSQNIKARTANVRAYTPDNGNYKLRYGTTNPPTGDGADLAAGTSGTDITGLAPDTTYYAQMISLGDGVVYTDSVWGSIHSFTTQKAVANPTVTLAVTSSTSLTPTIPSVDNAVSYKLRYGTTNPPTGDGADWTSGTAITGLTAGTQYYVQVMAVGDGTIYDNSLWGSVVSATTKIVMPTPIIEENEALTGLRAIGIRATNLSNSNRISLRYALSPAALSGNGNSVAFDYTRASLQIGPLQINTTYYVQLKCLPNDYNTQEESGWSNVLSITTDADTNAPVITLNGDAIVTITVGTTFNDPGATATDNVDGTVTVTSSGSVDTTTPGTYMLTYTATDSSGNTATKSRSVIVEALPQLNAPTVASVAKTATEATINFNAVDNAFDYSYRYGTTNPPTGDEIITSNPINLTGLTAVTTYYVQLKANGNGTTHNDSEWSDVYTIRTKLKLSAPTFLTSAISSTSTTARLGFNSNENAYGYAYRYGTTNPPTGDGQTISTTQVDITGLTPGTTYHVQLKSLGGISDTYADSDWGNAYAVTTKNVLSAVVAYGADVYAVNTTTLKCWIDLPSGANQNTVKIRYGTTPQQAMSSSAIETTGTLSHIVDNSKWLTLLGLSAGITYYIQIKAIPADSTLYEEGEWSNCVSGTTAKNKISKPTLNASGFTVTESAASSWVTLPTGASTSSINVRYALSESALSGDGTAINLTDYVTGSAMFAVSGLSPSTSYYLQIQCPASNTTTYDGSDWSDPVMVTTATPPDTNAPVITLIGNATMIVEYGATWSDPGATATDNVDGSITPTTAITYQSNATATPAAVDAISTTTPGIYTITYTATDTANNTATATRSVVVQPLTLGIIATFGDDYTYTHGLSECGYSIDETTGLTLSNLYNDSTYHVYYSTTPLEYGASIASLLTAETLVDAGTFEATKTIAAINTTGTYYITSGVSNGTVQEILTVVINTTSPPSQLAKPGVLEMTISYNSIAFTLPAQSVAANAIGYKYKFATTAAGLETATEETLTGTITKTGLSPNTPYYIITKSVGDGANYSDSFWTFASATNTTQLPQLDAPTLACTAAATTITPTIGTVDGAVSYKLRYGTETPLEDNGETWTSGTVITGLTPETQYHVQVMAVGNGTSNTDSDWSTAETITTLAETVEPDLDTTAPVITLNGDATVTITVGSTFSDPGATATDAVDGTVTVTSSGTVDTTTAGTYTITYTATDTANNTATATRTVVVESDTPDPDPDTTAPVITLIGNASMTITVGDTFNDPGATATDDVDGDITPIVTGTVDTATAGTYTLTYTATDSSNNTATVTRTVVVEAATPPPETDTTAPVITLTGAAIVSVEYGGSFTDPGATATDAVDGTVTVTSAITYQSNATDTPSNVDAISTTTAGIYTITYTATDAANNTATATRTVTVLPSSTWFTESAKLKNSGGVSPGVYAVRVRSTDSGGASIEKNLRITVGIADGQNPPENILIDNNTIASSDEEQEVGNLSTVDPDNPDDTHVYNVVSATRLGEIGDVFLDRWTVEPEQNTMTITPYTLPVFRAKITNADTGDNFSRADLPDEPIADCGFGTAPVTVSLHKILTNNVIGFTTGQTQPVTNYQNVDVAATAFSFGVLRAGYNFIWHLPIMANTFPFVNRGTYLARFVINFTSPVVWEVMIKVK